MRHHKIKHPMHALIKPIFNDVNNHELEVAALAAYAHVHR